MIPSGAISSICFHNVYFTRQIKNYLWEIVHTRYWQGSRCSIFMYLCSILKTIVCLFVRTFGHCIVCPSSASSTTSVHLQILLKLYRSNFDNNFLRKNEIFNFKVKLFVCNIHNRR